MKKNRSRIHLIKNKLFKNKVSVKSKKSENKQLTVNRPSIREKFIIKKAQSREPQHFDPKVNYFNKYWQVYYDNEYILAKIKETVYEIELMKTHIDELENINSP